MSKSKILKESGIFVRKNIVTASVTVSGLSINMTLRVKKNCLKSAVTLLGLC